jgi:uncharacterized phage-associated protein
MSVSSLSAARLVCELRDWKVTNLELQKILYIAHMIHLGAKGKPLISENFEAWDYGPVVPDLYQHVKGFGANPVRNVFHSVDLPDNASSEYDFIKKTVDALAEAKSSQLVAFTHREGSAWSKVYSVHRRGLVISEQLILDEYHDWKEQRRQ